MGVSVTFNPFLESSNKHEQAAEKSTSRPRVTFLILLCSALRSFIYAIHSELPWTHQGSYHTLSILLHRLLDTFALLNIHLYFVFDGPYPLSKHETVLSRLQQSCKTAQEFYATSVNARSRYKFLPSSPILPAFCYEAVNDVLTDRGWKSGVDLFHLASGEADGYCVSLAEELGAYVFGFDSDFAIFGFGKQSGLPGVGYQGYVPLDMIQWEQVLKVVEGEATMNGNGNAGAGTGRDEGFTVYQSKKSWKTRGIITPGETTISQNLVPPAIPEPTAKDRSFTLTFSFTIFDPASLATRLRIPQTYLPLLATIVGNDSSPPEAPALFFEKHMSKGMRIDPVARAIRECLLPGAKERINKKYRPLRSKATANTGSVSAASTATSSSTTETFGFENQDDELFSFISLVVASLLLRPMSETEMQNLVTKLIDSTCDYILPESATRLGLDLEFTSVDDLAMNNKSASSHEPCCPIYPYCGHVTIVGDDDSAKGRRGVFRSEARRQYAIARNAGQMRPFSSFVHPARTYHNTSSSFENTNGPVYRGTKSHRRLRGTAWRVLYDSIGWYREVHAFGYQEDGSRKDEEEVEEEGDTSAQSAGDQEVGAQGVEVVHESMSIADDGEQDQTNENSRGQPKIVEWLRADGSITVNAVELDLDIDVPSLRDEQGRPISIGTYEARMKFWLSAMGSDNLKTLAAPTVWQPLIAVIRFCIATIARDLHKPWTNKDTMNCLSAGMMSYSKWSGDWDPESISSDRVSLENKSCTIVALVNAAIVEAHQLAAALLLTNDIKNNVPLYRYMEGEMWHKCINRGPDDAGFPEALVSVRQSCFEAIIEGLESFVLGPAKLKTATTTAIDETTRGNGRGSVGKMVVPQFGRPPQSNNRYEALGL